MKINVQPPVSAFTVYSEKLRQKKKKKPVAGGINKPTTQKTKQFNEKEMEEIKNILVALSKQKEVPNSGNGMTVNEIKMKKKKSNSDRSMKAVKKVKDKSNSDASSENNAEVSKRQDEHPKQQKLKKIKASLNKKLNPSEDNNNAFIGIENKVATTRSENPDSCEDFVYNGIKSNLKPKKNEPSTKSKIKRKQSKLSSVIGSNTGMDKEKIKSETSPQKKKKLKIKHSKILKSQGVVKKSAKKKKLSVNRVETAKNLFEWLIQPIQQEDFMKDYWEKRPLLVRRESARRYYSELLSTPAIDAMLRENVVHFTKHLDVTSYTDGVRDTHNLTGRAQANVVWDFYANGCSVRLLSPQTFAPRLHALNATLQEWFGCLVGANAYLTPPSSQGFAPHYDDIEAFVLQIEGAKRWKVYAPRSEGETLPRTSSRNFTQEEVGGNEPLLDVTLEPGDLLYFPRGFVHQASTSTPAGRHSLHVTLSAYQRTAWVDLFEQALPIALRRAAAAEVDLRRGLPLGYLQPGRGAEALGGEAERLMRLVAAHLGPSLPAAVDRMGARFMHDALPPVLTAEEVRLSSRGGGLAMADNGQLIDDSLPEIEMDTRIKLISTNICRLVEDDESGEWRLHHCLDNQLEYHGEEPQYLVVPPGLDGATPVARLCAAYPAYVRVADLPHSDPEALLTLISDLWDAGLLLARRPQGEAH